MSSMNREWGRLVDQALEAFASGELEMAEYELTIMNLGFRGDDFESERQRAVTERSLREEAKVYARNRAAAGG